MPSGSSETEDRRRQITSYKTTTSSPATDTDIGPDNDNLRLCGGCPVPARRGTVRQAFIFAVGERWPAIPRPFPERPEVSTAPEVHPSSCPATPSGESARRGRLAVLNDAAAYFAALREALLLATHQVYIIGWDIHSQTRFVGPSGHADDGFPEELGPFLKALLRSKARPADRRAELGFSGALCRRTRVEFPGEVHDGHVGPASLLFRCQPSARFCPAPENRRHRRRGRIFRRARPDDPALGHQRARRRQSAPGAIPTASPIRRSTMSSAWSMAKPPPRFWQLVENRWRAAGCTVENCHRRRRRPLAGLGAGPGPRHHGGHRADRDQDRARSGRERGRAAVRGLHQRGKPLHLYREPVHQHHRDCARCWRSGCWTCRRFGS